VSSPVRSPRRLQQRARLLLPAATASLLLLLPSGPAVSATDPTTLADTTPTTPVNPVPPKVTTGSAEAIAGTTATLTATITAGGAPTTYRFQYGTSTAYGLTTAEATTAANASSATVKLPITGLTLGTTYHFRVLATNAAGSVQGADRTFTTTSAPKPPTVSTQAASKVTTSGAQLNARVNPQGQAGTVRFDWGTTTAYGNTTAEVAAGSGKGTVSRGATITALQPGTLYHYRAVAKNPTGTVVGRDRTFRTSRGLTAISAALSAPVMPWNGTLSITGTLAGAAPGGVRLELLRQDYPFTGPARRIGTTTTNAAGAYTLKLTRVFSAVRVRVRVIGSSTLVSPELPVASALLVRLQVGVRKARTTRLRGTLYPATTAARARLQRQSPSGRWITVRTLRLAAQPNQRVSFRTVVRRISRAATYRVVADPHDGGRHVRTTSSTVTIPARR
jgi:hypothetical protein